MQQLARVRLQRGFFCRRRSPSENLSDSARLLIFVEQLLVAPEYTEQVSCRSVRGKINFSIPEAIQPVGIAITHDGKTGFVALGPANRIAVIHAVTHRVQKYLLVGQRVWHMAFTPDDKYLLTTNGVSNDLSVIDVAALTSRLTGSTAIWP